MRYSGSGWSLETAGWQIGERDGTTVMVPCDADAALHLTCFTKNTAGLIGDGELRALADKGSPRDALRRAVRCGAFWGYLAEYVEHGAHWRVWWLAHGSTHVYATYNCHPENAGRHDAVVDWMLSTLQYVDG